MINFTHYLLLSTGIFCVGLAGLLVHRQNLIRLLMCVELLLLGVNTQFIAISHYFKQLPAQIMVFFTLTTAAAETALGLAILVLIFRNFGSVSADNLPSLEQV